MGVEVNCQVCRQPVEDDGYGELIHSGTGFYGAYIPDDPKYGKLQHVAEVGRGA